MRRRRRGDDQQRAATFIEQGHQRVCSFSPERARPLISATIMTGPCGALANVVRALAQEKSHPSGIIKVTASSATTDGQRATLTTGAAQ
jgi:hypothetical protein